MVFVLGDYSTTDLLQGGHDAWIAHLGIRYLIFNEEFEKDFHMNQHLLCKIFLCPSLVLNVLVVAGHAAMARGWCSTSLKAQVAMRSNQC